MMMMLNHILFSATTAQSSEAPDGETPEQIHLTEEANGYALWLCNFWEEQKLIEFFPGWKTRSEAIREAVLYTIVREQYRKQYPMKQERSDRSDNERADKQERTTTDGAKPLMAVALAALLGLSACSANESADVNSYGQQRCTVTINGEEKSCH